MLHVVYRVCDSVEVCSAKRRFCPLPKPQLIRGCLRSFLLPGTGAKFHVVADGCSDATVETVRSWLRGSSWFRDDSVERHDKLGNAASFCRCVEIAAGLPPDDCVLFLEDDYLALRPRVLDNVERAMAYIRDRGGRTCALMPDDYLDRYACGFVREGTDVCTTPVGDFMRIDRTTCTFAAFACDVARHRDDLLKFRDWPRVGENGSVNLMWKDVPLYCPLPAWTCHVQIESALPPYLDPKSISRTVEEFSR